MLVAAQRHGATEIFSATTIQIYNQRSKTRNKTQNKTQCNIYVLVNTHINIQSALIS